MHSIFHNLAKRPRSLSIFKALHIPCKNIILLPILTRSHLLDVISAAVSADLNDLSNTFLLCPPRHTVVKSSQSCPTTHRDNALLLASDCANINSFIHLSLDSPFPYFFIHRWCCCCYQPNYLQIDKRSSLFAKDTFSLKPYYQTCTTSTS